MPVCFKKSELTYFNEAHNVGAVAVLNFSSTKLHHMKHKEDLIISAASEMVGFESSQNRNTNLWSVYVYFFNVLYGQVPALLSPWYIHKGPYSTLAESSCACSVTTD